MSLSVAFVDKKKEKKEEKNRPVYWVAAQLKNVFRWLHNEECIIVRLLSVEMGFECFTSKGFP